MPRGDGLCGDFQRGQCTRGRDCKFFHGPSASSFVNGGGFKGDGYCGDFQRGWCKRGKDCKFKHGSAPAFPAAPFPAPAAVLPALSPTNGGFKGDGLCGDFQKGTCARGAGCKFLHSFVEVESAAGGGFKGDGLCGDFQKGSCTRGSACRFKHSWPGAFAPIVPAVTSGFKGDGLCGDFQKGTCARGSACKFVHSRPRAPTPVMPAVNGGCKSATPGVPRVPVVPLPVAPKIEPVGNNGGFKGDGLCGDFQKGICARGDDCKFLHETPESRTDAPVAPVGGFKGDGLCGDFQRGSCSRGKECKYLHAWAPPDRTPAPVPYSNWAAQSATALLQSALEMATPQRAANGFKGDGLCGDFQKGNCKRGADCKFLHPGARPAAGGGYKGDGMCGDFLRGVCHRGAECKYAHEKEEPPPRAAAGGGFRGDGLCGDYLKGACKRGDSCKFAHVERDRSRSPRRIPEFLQ